jgi:hypothetical protein
MRIQVAAVVAAVVLAALPLRSQTTGIPGLNDYTITCVGCSPAPSGCWSSGVGGGTGGVSGSTSCTPLYFNLSAGGTFTLSVSTTPGATVWIFTNPCLCTPCFAPLTPICGIPFTSCGGITNESVDLNLGFGCPLTQIFMGVAGGGGVFSATVTMPPLPPFVCLQLSTQAAVSSPFACVGPVIVTQAYDVYAGS